MKTGMIIVNYNDAVTTKKLIDNVKNYKCLDRIVIVDNNSTDNSKELLKKLVGKKVVLLESPENKGYSGALNIGCHYLIDLYNDCNIIISNSDIIIDSENDLITLLSYLKGNNVVVGPTIIQNNTLNRGWKIPSPWEDIILNIPYFGKKYQDKHLAYQDSYHQKNISKVESVSGCFFLISSKHLKDINYFDEGVFLYYEENILGVKTREKNKNIIVVNDVDIVHDHSISIDKSLKRIKKYVILKQSQYYFEKKYNHANKLQLFFLKFTAFLTKILLTIKYLID